MFLEQYLKSQGCPETHPNFLHCKQRKNPMKISTRFAIIIVFCAAKRISSHYVIELYTKIPNAFQKKLLQRKLVKSYYAKRPSA